MTENSEFRDSFYLGKYQDAPLLSDQLLLPNLAIGNDVFLATAFSTSYIFKLVRDLAATEKVEPGRLNIVFFVKGDLQLKKLGIARFKSYLAKYALHEVQVAQFIFDCLQLIEEEKLDIRIAHTSQKSPLIRGCLGVIRSNEVKSDLEDQDYVAFVDSKAGDNNSPVTPLKSWVGDDYFAAQDILARMQKLYSNQSQNSWLISGQEATNWLEYLADMYEQNPPTLAEDIASDDFDDEDEIDSGVVEFLEQLNDFDADEEYEWFSTDTSESYEFDLSRHIRVWSEVDSSMVERGHIPPLPDVIKGSYGMVGAVCVCGEIFLRADGCPRIDWGYEPDFGEE